MLTVRTTATLVTYQPPQGTCTMPDGERDQTHFSMRLTPKDVRLLDELAEVTGVTTRAELFRLALNFTLAGWPRGRVPSSDDAHPRVTG